MRRSARAGRMRPERAGLELRSAPEGLESERVLFGGREYLVLSFPAPRVPTDGLTEAEIAVLRDLLDGLTNREIGARRDTSARTVANQVASILRKLGFGSRYELVAHLSWSEMPAGTVARQT